VRLVGGAEVKPAIGLVGRLSRFHAVANVCVMVDHARFPAVFSCAAFAAANAAL
jgi:hypothetical protein